MTTKIPHKHYFTYYLKKSKNGGLSAQVRELPGIFAQGKTADEIKAALPNMTKKYLKAFSEIHDQINNNSAHVLIKPGFGKLIGVESFICNC
ncbi:MAG: hypothetical protein WBF38_02785 [Nitrosotalea sp.]